MGRMILRGCAPLLALMAATVIGLPAPLASQGAPGSVLPVVPVPAPHRPPPLNYFFRSLLIPGWGQASLHRKLTGGLFIAFEGLALSMALKAGHEVHYLERTDSARAESRRGEREDWLVLLAFNHLFSGLEAYVSAHLVDFPPDLHLRAFAGARPGFGVTIGLPHR